MSVGRGIVGSDYCKIAINLGRVAQTINKQTKYARVWEAFLSPVIGRPKMVIFPPPPAPSAGRFTLWCATTLISASQPFQVFADSMAMLPQPFHVVRVGCVIVWTLVQRLQFIEQRAMFGSQALAVKV